MKKKLFTKSISVFLSVLMLMSCWVFAPANHEHLEADAALAYGMSAVNGASKQNATFKDHRTDSTNDYVQIKYPSIMYMDISENLADTGYSVNISTSFGSGSNYKLVVLPSLWGGQEFNEGGNGTCGTAVYKGQTTMIDNFNDFGIVNGDLPGYYDNYSVDSSGNIALTCGSPGTNIGTGGFNAQFSGTAKATGTYSYQMNKANGTPMTAIYIKTGSGSYTKNSWANDSADTGEPTNYQIVVYDKSGLNTSINSANNYLTQTSKYTAESLNTLRTAVNTGNTILKTREVQEYQITDAKDAIDLAIKNLVVARNYDVTYENLFSISDWAQSTSPNFQSSASVEIALENNNTIKIYKNSAGGEVTTGSSYPNAHVATRYSIPVTGGKDYTVRYDIEASVSGTAQSEVFMFWYDANNNPVNNTAGSATFNNKGFGSTGTCSVTFTAPASATKAEIRFDNDCPSSGSTLRFKNIAVYPADRAAEVELDSWTVRPTSKTFGYHVTLSGKLDIPVRNGYNFNGWYLDDKNINGQMDSGEAVTDASGNVIRALTMDKQYNLYADWLPLPMDIGYDNMFSLAEWAKTNSTKPNETSRGTVTYDVMAGTITTESTSGGEVYTNYGTGSDQYVIAVEPNTEYIFEADMDLVTGDKGQLFVFFYNASGSGVSGAIYNGTAQKNTHIGIYPTTEGTSSITFTTPADCTKMAFRVGATNVGTKAVYSNIGLYNKADYDAYAKDYAVVRVPFNFGDTTQLSLVPVRAGYKFEGWFKADGTQLTSVDGLKASDTVYAKWVQMFTVTFKNWNGDVLKTQEVAPGASATAPANPVKDPDTNTEYVFDKWDTAFTNVQSELTVTAVFKTKDHSLVKSYVSGSTCTAAAKYTQYCTSCNFTWNGVLEDAAMPALGHTYNRAEPTFTVITGSTTGGKDTDLHTIKCNECDATKTVVHNFQLDAAHPATSATCIVAGETYYKCACLETKTEVGSVNPDNHVNTKTINAVAAECEKDGYTGDTFCNDCQKTVATGEATDALEHVYTTYTSNGDATCFANGTESALCDLCKDETKKATRTEEGSKLTHKYTNYVYNEGTAKCEVNGTETASCDHGCGTKDTREAANSALKHDFTGAYKNNENGTHSFLCKNGCGNYGATVDCEYGAWTKDNAATHSHTCTVCGYTPAAEAHDWSAWTTVGGSESEKATQTRSCNVCGRVEDTECNYVVEDHKDVTCEAAELTTYKCSDCGHGYTVIGATPKGHNFNGTAKNNNDGTHSFACANGCGEYGFGTTKNMGVPCSDWTYANTEAGKHTATCDDCGYVKAENCSGGEATCTAEAVCQFCNTAYGEKAPHSYTGNTYFDGVEKAKDATCTAQAEYYTYCEFCKVTSKGTDKEATFAYGDLLPHTYTGNTEFLHKATEAKCGVNETYYAYCSACKASSEGTAEEATFEKADTALKHVWVNAQHNADTLTHTFTCERTCGETMTANCADSAVSYGYEPATCTEQGYDIVQCSVCNYQWNINYIDAHGHDYAKQGAVKEAANCEHGTIYWYDCKWCDAKGADETDTEKYPVLFFEDTDKRAHFFQNKVDEEYLADKATCFAAAKYYTSCRYEDCGKSSEVVYGEGKGVKFSSGSALTHVFDKQVETYLATEADCVNNATYYYVCSLCDTKGTTTWEKEDSKTGHTMEYTAAVDATCDKAGNYEYWYCSVCKKYFKDVDGNEAYANQAATVIAKREHDKVKVTYVAATCEIDGTPAHEYCAYENCSYTTIPENLDAYNATGHIFAGAYYYDAVNNYHAKYCVNANCDKVTLIDAEGNEYKVNSFGMIVDGEQVKYTVEYDGLDYVIKGGIPCEFTYTESTVDGVHSHANKCVCGNANTKVYSDEETFVKTIAPTCTAKGYDSFACPDCDATWIKNEVANLGHTAAEKATPNGDGTHSVRCTVDGCNYAISTAKCSGGTATCSELAVCTECLGEYGTTGDHVFEAEWQYNEGSAKCEVNGTESNYCTACEQTITREAEGTALEHAMSKYVYALPDGVTIAGFDPSVLVEPTCREDGFAVSYCILCFNSFKTKTVRNDKNAHIWKTDGNGELVWEPAGGNCATGVTMVNECTVCDKTQSKVVSGVHTWTISAKVEANCEVDSYIVFKCSACSFTLLYDKNYDGDPIYDADGNPYELTEKLGHTWEREGSTDTLIVDKESTCAIAGRGHYVCGDCQDESDSVVIEKLAHTLINVDEQKATCTIDGYGAYVKCVACAYDQHLDAEWLAVEGNYTKATGHADNNSDGKCDGCKKEMVGDSTDYCECICHKDGWFSKIIYKILHFFWKLFKIGKSCDCGTIHY